ncbi:MAG: carotenoid 1,2-hydratase [Gemmatimonadetes bacterium]|nr:carotenoid 1,2-hydratase [Gemmatimonadota bacterium]
MGVTPAGKGNGGGWLLVFLAAALLGACGGTDRASETRLSLAETLAGADTAGYERALAPRDFDFPADHGPHPGFRTEWWYVTGNLTSTSGRDFGFQLTIFRSALAPRIPDSRSAWATNQAYMAHFTVTDVSAERFHAYERFARGAVELAGATADPSRVWLEGWTIEGTTSEPFPLRLRAREGDVALDLALEAGKPAVPQGDRGLSQKGPGPGNASYYYSHTRMPAAGTLVVGGDTLAVSGLAWLDREWSTSALSEGQVGWDWFAIQLDDGWDLMAYRLRSADGSTDAWSDAVVVDPLGVPTRLAWGTQIIMESTGTWTSPIDDAVYPSGWRVTVPGHGWSLAVEPRIPDQELDLAFRYWEGAVFVRGTGEGGAPVEGRGYVELTGYAGEAPER